MNLDHVFKKTKTALKKRESTTTVPDGLLCRCSRCKKPILVQEVRDAYYICPKCGGYFKVRAYERIRRVADEGTFQESDRELVGKNPLGFEGYEEKLAAERLKTRMKEAIVTGTGSIDGIPAALGVMDSRFMMASMGWAVGEKLTRLIEKATTESLPLILFTCSGGARMQEGIHSLMQMAKVSAAMAKHHAAGLLSVCVLTDPTTGGVTASFAMEGDVILAEPNALIGFAGPRVIEQTIGQRLPKGFQRSEFLMEHGFVDRITERSELKKVLADLCRMHDREYCKKALCQLVDTEIQEGAKKNPAARPALEQKESGSAWEHVLAARRADRPVGSDYIRALFSEFYEFHGDRRFGDDPALIGGIGLFEGVPVTVIAQEKGTSAKDRVKHNFGMCQPEGYRKALRLMKEAEKFHRPVLCFIDTPGAFCGIGAEERGQGSAIAENLLEISRLKTPVVSIFIGEGGSGGALALACGDEVWMMENAVYSVLSPEGFASILWKDKKRAPEAADKMKLTAEDVVSAQAAERRIKEPEKLTTQNMGSVLEQLREELRRFLKQYAVLESEKLCDRRYERFRKL